MDTISLTILTDLVEKICVIFVLAYLLTRLKYFTEVIDGKLTIKNQLILVRFHACLCKLYKVLKL